MTCRSGCPTPLAAADTPLSPTKPLDGPQGLCHVRRCPHTRAQGRSTLRMALTACWGHDRDRLPPTAARSSTNPPSPVSRRIRPLLHLAALPWAATSLHVDRLIGATPSARSFAPLAQYDTGVWRMITACTALDHRTASARFSQYRSQYRTQYCGYIERMYCAGIALSIAPFMRHSAA